MVYGMIRVGMDSVEDAALFSRVSNQLDPKNEKPGGCFRFWIEIMLNVAFTAVRVNEICPRTQGKFSPCAYFN